MRRDGRLLEACSLALRTAPDVVSAAVGQNLEALQFCVCADLRYQMKEVLRKARREIFLETQMRQQPTQISAGQRTMPELRAAQEQNAMDFARCLLQGCALLS